MNSEDPRIDLFIDNEMSEDERLLFLQEMENDAELKSKVLFKQFIIDELNKNNIKINSYSNIKLQIQNNALHISNKK